MKRNIYQSVVRTGFMVATMDLWAFGTHYSDIVVQPSLLTNQLLQDLAPLGLCQVDF